MYLAAGLVLQVEIVKGKAACLARFEKSVLRHQSGCAAYGSISEERISSNGASPFSFFCSFHFSVQCRIDTFLLALFDLRLCKIGNVKTAGAPFATGPRLTSLHIEKSVSERPFRRNGLIGV